MPELTPAIVQTYTKGRLLATDPETVRLLASALRAARNYCGWHVTPIRTETLELDGPGGRVLSLPTRHIIEVTEVIELEVSVAVDSLRMSKRLGVMSKRSGDFWSREYGSISVTLTHGHADAEDFDQAVLAAIDAVSLSVGLSSEERGPGTALIRKRVDDTELQWADSDMDQAMNRSLLDAYAIL